MSRVLERLVVRTYIYPSLLQPPEGLYFSDQFAFRPTGSTSAALITMFHTISTMLSTNPFVRVFSLDFSKAFDTVRHCTLLDKMARLNIPDEVYNWIADFYDGRGHSTKFRGEMSVIAQLESSVIQGSSFGPAAYIVTAADLRPVNADNEIIKFADDTYLIIPATNSSTSELELNHIRSWATSNNLQLNHTKSKELVFFAQRGRLHTAQHPPVCQGIEQVESLTALGVTINNRFSVTEHVTKVLSSCSGLLYALRILRTHGMNATSLYDVFRATIVAKLYTVHRHGPASVLQRTYLVSTRLSSDANDMATAQIIF